MCIDVFNLFNLSFIHLLHYFIYLKDYLFKQSIYLLSINLLIILIFDATYASVTYTAVSMVAPLSLSCPSI